MLYFLFLFYFLILLKGDVDERSNYNLRLEWRLTMYSCESGGIVDLGKISNKKRWWSKKKNKIKEKQRFSRRCAVLSLSTRKQRKEKTHVTVGCQKFDKGFFVTTKNKKLPI